MKHHVIALSLLMVAACGSESVSNVSRNGVNVQDPVIADPQPIAAPVVANANDANVATNPNVANDANAQSPNAWRDATGMVVPMILSQTGDSNNGYSGQLQDANGYVWGFSGNGNAWTVGVIPSALNAFDANHFYFCDTTKAGNDCQSTNAQGDPEAGGILWNTMPNWVTNSVDGSDPNIYAVVPGHIANVQQIFINAYADWCDQDPGCPTGTSAINNPQTSAVGHNVFALNMGTYAEHANAFFIPTIPTLPGVPPYHFGTN